MVDSVLPVCRAKDDMEQDLCLISPSAKANAIKLQRTLLLHARWIPFALSLRLGNLKHAGEGFPLMGVMTFKCRWNAAKDSGTPDRLAG
jgi:hypothetical protein